MKHALFLFFFFLFLSGCVKSKPDGADAGQASRPVPTSAATANSTSSTAFTVQQCESLVVDAERKLAEARNQAPVDCKKDDDCQLIETSACVPACVDRAVAKKGVAAYSKERDMLRSTSCKLWNDAECPRTTPKPAPQCKPMKVACNANKCEAVPAP